MTEIFLENNRLDISADISALLTFALDDVKDFSSRQTTFSKTIVLPGTANNNMLFGHVFDTGSANIYDPALNNVGYNFNAAKSASVIIFQDNLQTFKGKLRLLSIVRDGKKIEYEVAMFGNLTALNVALAPSSQNNADGTTSNNTGYLENLDFSEHDHEYSVTNITGSWDNTPGNGYYYPLIDYGNYSNAAIQSAHSSIVQKHDWIIGTFRPALYVKEYIDKMFASAGFTYVSSLFSSTRFKGLIIPHNQKLLQRLTTSFLTASGSAITPVLASSGRFDETFQFSTVDDTSAISDEGDHKKFKYNGADPVTVNISFDFDGYRRNHGTNSFLLKAFVGGVEQTSLRATLSPNNGPVDFDIPFYWTATFAVTLNHNDEIYFEMQTTNSGGDSSYFLRVDSASLSVVSGGEAFVDVAPGDTVQVNHAIPRNIKQIDFLVSIVKLFNLYVWEDQYNPTKIYIEPFVDYYSPDSSNAIDWTYKLNRGKPVTIKPMSELTANVYNFKMADDSDYYNDLYKKRYNQNYGDYIFNSQFEFSTDSQDCQLIFAGTPLVGYSGEDKVYSTIFKRSGDGANLVEEQTDSVIRILQTKKIGDDGDAVANWKIYDASGTALSSNLTTYGYAGHFNSPDPPPTI